MRRLCLAALLLLASLSPARQEQVLAAGDKLVVNTAGLEQYSGEYLVGVDGSVTLGRYGRFVAAGRTVAELEREVVAAARRLIREPQVTLGVHTQAARRVYLVSDQVANGIVDWQPGMTARQIVARVSRLDALDSYEGQLFRDGTLLRRLDLRALLSGSVSAEDPPLLPGDVVTLVPAASVFVAAEGLVLRPGPVRVRPGSTVSSVIAQAGGVPAALLESFTPEQVVVTLRRDGEAKRMSLAEVLASSGPAVEDGDAVVVAPPALVRAVVGGRVRNPGAVTLLAGATLAEAVEMAGGTGAEGGLHAVAVVREGEAYRFDVRTGAGAAAEKLQDGDFVFVPATDRVVHVFGFVAQPGPKLMPQAGPMRMSDALGLAGGLNAKGVARRAVLVRPGADGKYQATHFNLDAYLRNGDSTQNPELLPGDVVYFDQTKGTPLNDILRTIPGLFYLDRIFD